MKNPFKPLLLKLRATHMKIAHEADVHYSLSVKLPNLNNRFRRINSGGCGMVAFELAKKLRKQNIPANVVMVGSIDGPGILQYTKSWLDVRLALHEVNDISELTLKLDSMIDEYDDSAKIDLPNGHLCVEVYGKLYDATGDVSDKYIDITGPITDEAMTVMLNQESFWNPCFIDIHGDELDDINALINDITDIKDIKELITA